MAIGPALMITVKGKVAPIRIIPNLSQNSPRIATRIQSGKVTMLPKTKPIASAKRGPSSFHALSGE